VRLPRLIGQSRALDMILTGRAVDAREAHAFGLVNRLAPAGQLDVATLELARQIAELPQACMRNDRKSAYGQWGLAEAAAMQNEFKLGLATLASGETGDGASRFAGGAGRHGQ
jgi:enoyl-CoA hydratase